MSAASKRGAQSPIMGDDQQAKRRNILDNPPSLVTLDEISDSSQSDAELDLPLKLLEDKEKPTASLSVDEKVDTLIGRMDRFLECFTIMSKKTAKKDKKTDKKFKSLESAHNDLVSKVVDSTTATDTRLAELEERLALSEDVNKNLSDKLTALETNHDRQIALQHKVNAESSEKMVSLVLNQGFTDRNVLDLASEVKERKIIISRVQDVAKEDITTTALECINKVINAAITGLESDASLDGLRILMPTAIDNVFRIGKPRGNKSKRNISVTFIRKVDKDMVLKACSATKNSEEIKFFISDDLTPDGRALKAQLKRISTVAKSKGMDTKLSGNKVTVNSRSYASNELKLIPGSISEDLKQEKNVKGGIVYRGDMSIYSNFFPSPLNIDGENYVHVEQFYQYTKATHHGDTKTAERILQLANPWRIKVLGDNIPPNEKWNAKRMKTLYEGVSAKFRQNWPLQDELLKSKDLKLYEATTDPYFGCGIGFDSQRWNTMDWSGDNVAGLVVMKVREELLHELSNSPTGDNTLTQIASGQEDEEQMDVGGEGHDTSPLESTLRDDHQPLNTSPLTSSTTHSYTDVVKSTGKLNSRTAPRPNIGRGQSGRRGHSPRGYVNTTHSQPNYTYHTRGRGQKSQHRRNFFPSRRPHDMMSQDDKDFLFGYQAPQIPDEDGYITPTARKTIKSPTSKVSGNNTDHDWANVLNLSEHQKNGLIELGLTPSSDFVKSIVSLAKKP